MHVASMTFELRLPDCHSLKDKRSIIRPILEGARRRFSVAAAEVGRADAWQASTIAMATVSSSPAHAASVLDSVERFVWSFPEIEVLSSHRNWMSDGDD